MVEIQPTGLSFIVKGIRVKPLTSILEISVRMIAVEYVISQAKCSRSSLSAGAVASCQGPVNLVRQLVESSSVDKLVRKIHFVRFLFHWHTFAPYLAVIAAVYGSYIVVLEDLFRWLIIISPCPRSARTRLKLVRLPKTAF